MKPGISERRERVLTDEDIAELLRRIDAAENARWIRQMETIGYDVSTPDARAAILDDHKWVRDWRTGSSKAKLIAMMMFMTAVLGGVGKIFWDGAVGWIKAIASVKGGA